MNNKLIFSPRFLFVVVFVSCFSLLSDASHERVCSDFVLPQKVRIVYVQEGAVQRAVVLDYNGKQVARFEQGSPQSRRYDVYDMQDKLVLTGQETRLSTGAVIELKNCRGDHVGRIVQDSQSSFVGAADNYNVLGAKGELLFQIERKPNDTRLMRTFEMKDRNSAKWAHLTVAQKLKRFEAAVTGEVMSPEHTSLLLATLKLYASKPRP